MPRLVVGTENGAEVSLFYEDFGTGPPVVLVHGWPLSQRSWEPQVRPFVRAGYRVITYDRRGVGRSTQTWAGYEYDTFAADLRALVESLHLAGMTLVGCSTGAGDVARYLGAHGTAGVAAVVFASGRLPAAHATPDTPEGRPDYGSVADLVGASARHRIALLDEVLTTVFSVRGEPALDEPTRRYHLQLAAAASPKGTTDSIEAWATADFRADLASVDIPALVVHGDCDAVAPYETSGKRTGAAIPGSETVLIPDGPHGVALTHPQQWNDAVLAFLRRCADPRGNAQQSIDRSGRPLTDPTVVR